MARAAAASDQQSCAQERRRFLTARIIAAMTKRTMNKIKERSSTYRNRLSPETKSCIRDMRSTGYGWLLPGWVAEERLVKSGRVYRYYYDPEGRLYKSQTEVITAWEKCGLIVLDRTGELIMLSLSQNLSLLGGKRGRLIP